MTVMKMSRRGFACGLAVVLAMPGPLLARASEPGASAKTFVQQIYGSYVGNSAQNAKGIPLENPSIVKRYFTPGLASLMLEDSAAARKRGEPPTLDGDPFVGKQDWNIADLLVDVKEAGAKATATVSFTDAGKAEKVVVELLKVGESWRIADIQWDSGTLRGLYRKK
jgi:hypothetical protein